MVSWHWGSAFQLLSQLLLQCPDKQTSNGPYLQVQEINTGGRVIHQGPAPEQVSLSN